jgi:hypothetical protein
MVPVLGSSADAEAVRKPQPAPLRLTLRHFQTLASPQTLDPFVVHSPALPLQHRCDPPIPVAAEDGCQLCHPLYQRSLVIRRPRSIALDRSRLP